MANQEKDKRFLYVIKSGQCKIVKRVVRKNQFDRFETKKEFIMMISEGEVFGEAQLLDLNQNYSVIVQSQQCIVFRVEYSEFKKRYQLTFEMLKKYCETRN